MDAIERDIPNEFSEGSQMPDGSKSWRFERGLDDDFMEKLEEVAKQKGWFTNILADTSLILGIRKNYLNIYRLGQSLFKIEREGKHGPLKFSTHPKYLVDPDLYKAVPFDGSKFDVANIELLLEKYQGSETLDRMKRAAMLYRGDEKNGVHAIINRNPNVIDTEIAFSREAATGGSFAPRIDLACLEKVDGTIRLHFWEAKLFANADLRAEGNGVPRVIEQIRAYRALVEKHREDIKKSYHKVAKNLKQIAPWATPARKVGELVCEVSAANPIVIDKTPVVGLIIYGYDDAQWKNERWKHHLEKLKAEPHMPIRHAGNARNIHFS